MAAAAAAAAAADDDVDDTSGCISGDCERGGRDREASAAASGGRSVDGRVILELINVVNLGSARDVAKVGDMAA